MIVRTKRFKEYTVLSNDLLNDERLSAEALASLVHLLSKPPDWIVRREYLKSRFGWGRDKSRKIMSELENLGYLVKFQKRDRSGRFSEHEYGLFDQPMTKADVAYWLTSRAVDGLTVDGLTVDGLTVDGLTVDGKTDPLQSKEPLKSKENKQSKEGIQSRPAPSHYDGFDTLWGDGVKPDDLHIKNALLKIFGLKGQERNLPELISLFANSGKNVDYLLHGEGKDIYETLKTVCKPVSQANLAENVLKLFALNASSDELNEFYNESFQSYWAIEFRHRGRPYPSQVVNSLEDARRLASSAKEENTLITDDIGAW